MSDSDLELYGIVGKMFREIRERKELSLETVAEYLKIAPKSLQRYECGERKIKKIMMFLLRRQNFDLGKIFMTLIHKRKNFLKSFSITTFSMTSENMWPQSE